MLDEGWLTFDTVKLATLSAPITARSNQAHTLDAEISGELDTANSARLFVKYSDGTIVNMWQNDGLLRADHGHLINNFTTPANITSFQIGTEVALDKGYLAFDAMMLDGVQRPIYCGYGRNFIPADGASNGRIGGRIGARG